MWSFAGLFLSVAARRVARLWRRSTGGARLIDKVADVQSEGLGEGHGVTSQKGYISGSSNRGLTGPSVSAAFSPYVLPKFPGDSVC